MKLQSFYQSDGKTVLSDLFDKKAEDIAKDFCFKEERNGKVYEGVSSTQLRRLFDEVKRFDVLLAEKGEFEWGKQEPYIRMIKSKVAYMIARAKKTKSSSAKYYDKLGEFISSGIDLVKDKNDYHIFVSLFEAVYGFYYGMAPRE